MRFLALIVVLLSQTVSAQELTKEALHKLREGTQRASFKAKQNVTTNNPISYVALSRENAENQDRNFTHVIKRGKVTDQQRSGRCWLFAGFNVVRYDVAASLGVGDFELSENYTFFYHKLELSNSMLEMAITNAVSPDDPYVAWVLRNGLSDGGYWNMFAYLVQKYGAVPKSAMPETLHSSNTRELNVLLDSIVKKHVAAIWGMRQKRQPLAALRAYKAAAIAEIYQFLALTLGTPPEHFSWRYVDAKGVLHGYRQDTPEGFSNKYVRPVLGNLVHLMNDPTLAYFSRFSLLGAKNVIEEDNETFLNVPAADLVKAAQRSVLANRPVWFGSDVGAYMDIKNAMLSLDSFDYDGLLGISTKMSKADRLRTYSSAATHAMVLFGVDEDILGVPVKWLVENSWGPGAGENGYLIMTNEWFQEYGFDIIVNKRFIAPEVAAVISRPPEELPLWHHLNRL